uniref:D-alanyl-D-alanine dipeptidase n=2 Tax=Candidatus Kentrum sp. TC TaxID=2126339 RepID=A0A451A015_9GAMM|nr:MAG: D-alanyl-D-alanine dipeptidase [Candidatus Kentron sp. TC]
MPPKETKKPTVPLLPLAIPPKLLEPIPIWEQAQIEKWRTTTVTFELDRPESNERLVDVQDVGLAADAFYGRNDGLNFPYCRDISRTNQIFLRQSVANCLFKIKEMLMPFGIEPLVLDGHRDLSTQTGIRTFFVSDLMRRFPSRDADKIRVMANDYCWDPATWIAEDPTSWPVHMTGGSVDLTLRVCGSGEYTFMGSVYDDPSPLSHADAFERIISQKGGEEFLTLSEITALYSRRIIHNAVRLVGLAHYWAEWWHFDYGTQLYARTKAQDGTEGVAFYAAIPKRAGR